MKIKMYVGQEVKCVDATGVKYLTLGEKYLVESVERTPEYQYIKIGNGADVYNSNRFEVSV